MLNEGTQQRLILGDVEGCSLRLPKKFRKFGGREIGQRVGLGVAPDQLDGIECWGVRRQPMGPHTAASGEPGTDRAPVVGLQPIPDQFDRCAHGTRELFDKSEDGRAVVVGIGQKTEVRTRRRRGEIMSAPITETLRRERPRCVSTGVCPQGDRVRRTSGAIRKPASSMKTRAVFLRAAFFLPAAAPL